jgi:CRISPR-associated endoribonuclease Cas6
MRYILELELENKVIPIEYRRSVISFIKNSLSQYNGDLFDKYYDNNDLKPFTFAVKLIGPDFDNDFITLNEPLLKISFSTSDSSLGIQAYNAFLLQKNKKFSIENNNMLLKRVVIQRDLKINSDKILIKMLSPLVLREHAKDYDYYYSVKHDDFE